MKLLRRQTHRRRSEKVAIDDGTGSSATDDVTSQIFHACVQNSTDVISAVSEPAHLVAHQRTQHSIVVRPAAVRAISTDIICQTIVQHCRTSDLELTATCCVKLRLSLYFQIQT